MHSFDPRFTTAAPCGSTFSHTHNRPAPSLSHPPPLPQDYGCQSPVPWLAAPHRSSLVLGQVTMSSDSILVPRVLTKSHISPRPPAPAQGPTMPWPGEGHRPGQAMLGHSLPRTWLRAALGSQALLAVWLRVCHEVAQEAGLAQALLSYILCEAAWSEVLWARAGNKHEGCRDQIYAEGIYLYVGCWVVNTNITLFKSGISK